MLSQTGVRLLLVDADRVASVRTLSTPFHLMRALSV